MTQDRWPTLLRDLSRAILDQPDLAGDLPQPVVASGWLGYPGASEEEIREAERRLGVRLPPSYRTFLSVSNGWRTLSPFIDRLWSAREIAWFNERHPDWVESWMADSGGPVSDADYFDYGPDQAEYNLRPEYLATALEVSDIGDSAVVLLNPKVVTPEGEWEAWFLASWLPGARRYRSFQDLVEGERDSLLVR